MFNIKDFLLYGGLSKERYKNIKTRINDENRKSSNFFTLLGALFFFVSAISSTIHNEGIPVFVYYSAALIFILMFILNITLSKKIPIISDIFAICFSVILLGLGIYLAYGQINERTTTLLPLFGIVSLVFCYRPIYLISILTLTEIVYLIIMKGAQPENLFFVNKVNTLIFSSIGVVTGIYTLLFKYKKHEAGYETQVLLERDVLTGLYNRYSWNNALKRIEKENIDFSFCSLDVNGLKRINDSKGHLAGDKLIIAASICISETFKEYGEVYRIGGDEFSVLIYKDYNEQELRNILLNKTKEWEDDVCGELSISLGMSKYVSDGDISLTEVINIADKEMYQEKQKYHLEHDEQ